MVEDIVNIINANISETISGKDKVLFGISQTAIVIDSKGETRFPAIIDNDGECHYTFLDDKFKFGCYHKLIGKTYNQVSGFGRNNRDVEIAEIMIICWGFRNKLRMSSEQVESNIIIPCLPKEGILFQSNFDQFSIFSSEFKGIDFNIRPNEFLLSVKYKVQYAFNRECRK